METFRRWALTGGFLLLMCTPGHADTASGGACPAVARAMVRVELLFGTNRKSRPPVGGAEWGDFIRREVSPRFPDGFTIFEGAGQWRGKDGRPLREQSHLLLILHAPSEEAETAIEAIRTAYKSRFGQESVMRIDGASCVAF